MTIAVDEDAERAVLGKEMEARGITFAEHAPLGPFSTLCYLLFGPKFDHYLTILTPFDHFGS